MADRRVDDDIADRILGAVEDLPGIRLAIPFLRESAGRSFRDDRKLAVDLTPEVIEIRVVATMLPLPPLLERAAATIRAVLSGTAWEGVELRLVVAELDTAAVARGEMIG
ncbi:hypothetical protein [Nocardia paucivorans]|uniref:hypothetical protein n=1 Tax=Nocardia paucivorans TaxID=114259 RepID=UPI0002D28D7B|nr:hypothetical protein [Nocardia paucivorans]